MADQRRLNGFFSRARRGLIMVGDAATLGRNQTWSNLIKWGLQNRLLLQLE